MLELADMDFEAATINTYKDVRENDYSKWKAEKSQQGCTNYKNSRPPKYNYLGGEKHQYCMVLTEDLRLQKKEVADFFSKNDCISHPTCSSYNITLTLLPWSGRAYGSSPLNLGTPLWLPQPRE